MSKLNQSNFNCVISEIGKNEEYILKTCISLDPLKYLLAFQYCFSSNIFLAENTLNLFA